MPKHPLAPILEAAFGESLAPIGSSATSTGEFMKRNYWLTLSAAAVFGMITLGSTMQAQDTQQPSTPPQTQQPPDTQAPAPQQTAPAQTPDQNSQMPSSSSQAPATPDQSQVNTPDGGTSEYVGTVVKQGDKYVFQDAASGQTYDIDHQDEVKKFEGKKVRVKGTLDPSTKTIHVQ
jgi:hypothetical protein